MIMLCSGHGGGAYQAAVQNQVCQPSQDSQQAALPGWYIPLLLFLFLFSHDRPIVQGYPDGCQHRFRIPAEAKDPYPMRGRQLL